jgi:hypothetical protein
MDVSGDILRVGYVLSLDGDCVIIDLLSRVRASLIISGEDILYLKIFRCSIEVSALL